MMGNNPETLKGDLMIGAAPIALFLFGEDDDETRRKIYDMKPEERKALGIFKWGKRWAALKTTLRQNIAALAEPERAAIADAPEHAETKGRAKAAKKGGR
jgi:hypothetical protein